MCVCARAPHQARRQQWQRFVIVFSLQIRANKFGIVAFVFGLCRRFLLIFLSDVRWYWRLACVYGVCELKGARIKLPNRERHTKAIVG